MRQTDNLEEILTDLEMLRLTIQTLRAEVLLAGTATRSDDIERLWNQIQGKVHALRERSNVF
jgi:hypothetical protein